MVTLSTINFTNFRTNFASSTLSIIMFFRHHHFSSSATPTSMVASALLIVQILTERTLSETGRTPSGPGRCSPLPLEQTALCNVSSSTHFHPVKSPKRKSLFAISLELFSFPSIDIYNPLAAGNTAKVVSPEPSSEDFARAEQNRF